MKGEKQLLIRDMRILDREGFSVGSTETVEVIITWPDKLPNEEQYIYYGDWKLVPMPIKISDKSAHDAEGDEPVQ